MVHTLRFGKSTKVAHGRTRVNSSPSVYTANNTGDSKPPCLTPFMTVKDYDITLPHLTLNVWFVYINNNNLKTKGDISRFNNFLTSLQ